MFTSVHAVTLVACDTFSITKCTYFYSRVLVLPHPPLDIFIEAAGSLLSGSLQPVRQKASKRQCDRYRFFGFESDICIYFYSPSKGELDKELAIYFQKRWDRNKMKTSNTTFFSWLWRSSPWGLVLVLVQCQPPQWASPRVSLKSSAWFILFTTQKITRNSLQLKSSIYKINVHFYFSDATTCNIYDLNVTCTTLILYFIQKYRKTRCHCDCYEQ